jgi:hypothetical protein
VAHWLSHFIGADDGTGFWYLFWSGFISDVGLLGIVGTTLRRHKCEVHRCWRMGRHGTAAGHTVCRHHMPGGAPSHARVLAAHRLALHQRTGGHNEPGA